MTIDFKDILDAFDFVSFGEMHDHQAFLDTKTGKIYWHSEFGDNVEELPDDIDDDKYVEIPHKNDLELGKSLVFKFAHEYLPDEADKIDAFFRKKGAYSKFKTLLEEKSHLDTWYEYESQAHEKALREWCEINNIKLRD